MKLCFITSIYTKSSHVLYPVVVRQNSDGMHACNEAGFKIDDGYNGHLAS
jgi:hypothetical protein